MTFRHLRRGNKIQSLRLGEVEFYKHNERLDRLEVFDKYGVLRILPVKEYDYDQREGLTTGEPADDEALGIARESRVAGFRLGNYYD